MPGQHGGPFAAPQETYSLTNPKNNQSFSAFALEYARRFPSATNARDPFAGARGLWMAANSEITRRYAVIGNALNAISYTCLTGLLGYSTWNGIINHALPTINPLFLTTGLVGVATGAVAFLAKGMVEANTMDIFSQMRTPKDKTYLAPVPDAPSDRKVFNRALQMLNAELANPAP